MITVRQLQANRQTMIQMFQPPWQISDVSPTLASLMHGCQDSKR